MRFATYNVEWFTALFDDDNALVRSTSKSARYQISKHEQADAIARVLTTVDADAILIVEAPETHGKRQSTIALESFAGAYGLRTCEAVAGFATDTKQEIALLFDPDRLTAIHTPRAGVGDIPRFDGVFSIDLDVDATKDEVRFSKPPLELLVETKAGTQLQIIGAHLKSKAPHGAKTADDIKRVAIANRRKQLAQAIWLRARVDQILADGASLLVMGDLNDGPGLDAFESLFGRSSVEIVLGSEAAHALYDPHADVALSRRFGPVPTSSRFWIDPEKRYMQALLDYIMVSPDLRGLGPDWRIWHPFDDPQCWGDETLRNALLMASDHFPVSLDLPI